MEIWPPILQIYWIGFDQVLENESAYYILPVKNIIVRINLVHYSQSHTAVVNFL